MNKGTISKAIIFILVPIQLLFFTFLVPPFQKPDEQQHFEESLIISKGIFNCPKKSGNIVTIEKKYYDLIKNPYLDLMTHKKLAKLPVQLFSHDLFYQKQSNQKINFNFDHLCSFPVISYILQAMVLTVLNWLNISPFLEIFIVRFVMGLICYLGFLYLYRKIADPYKPILLFTFALPMTLHQITSFSYDAANIMLALAFFTLFVNNNLKKKVGMMQLIKLFVVMFFLLWSKKIGYEPFFLFLFLLPINSEQLFISTLVLIPFYIVTKLNGSFDIHSSLTSLVINPIRQFNFLVSNPVNIFKVIFLTTVYRAGFYAQSLIGIFGWLEYGLDPISYFLYGLFFIYTIMSTKLSVNIKQNQKQNYFLLLILIISYVFILMLAFFFNSSVGSLIVQGVQGRYFIPLLPFFIFLLAQVKDQKFFQRIFFWLPLVFLIFSTFYSIFHRYY